MSEDESAESLKQAHAAARETSRLASFILDKFPREPGAIDDSESAVDVAIRLLTESIGLRTTYSDMWDQRDRWRTLASRFIGAACDGEEETELRPLSMAARTLRLFREQWEDVRAEEDDPAPTDRALIAAELMIENFKVAVEDGDAIFQGKPTHSEQMGAATLEHFRQRFGELATAARELVAVIREAEHDGRLDERQRDAFHKLQSALPEPKDAPVQLVASIKSIEKAAAVCALLADLADLDGAADIEGPSEILSFLNDAVRLALEARGEAGPGEAPGFKVGRCYKHPGGEEIMVVGRALTILYGDCLVGESNKSSELKPLGKDTDAMQNWEEIPREHFALNFGD